MSDRDTSAFTTLDNENGGIMSHTEGKLMADALNVTLNGVQKNYYRIGKAGTSDVVAITGEVGGIQDEPSRADASRFVACWNAMDGIGAPELWVEQMRHMDADHTISLGIIDGLRLEIDALKAENERLRKDAERLDFLNDPSISLGFYVDDDLPFYISRVTGGRNDKEWKTLGTGESARAAIDAAMKGFST